MKKAEWNSNTKDNKKPITVKVKLPNDMLSKYNEYSLDTSSREYFNKMHKSKEKISDNFSIDVKMKLIIPNKVEEKKFTGNIMWLGIPVARVKDDEVTMYSDQAPLYFTKNNGDFKGWLRSRSIDTHRVNSRMLRKRLSIKTNQEEHIVLKQHAFSMTDRFWVKEDTEILDWNDVSKVSDELYELALNGIVDFDSKWRNINTPELTNLGSFEKCWKKINDLWYMIKKGSIKETFAEIFAYNLGKNLGMNVTEYTLFNDNKYYCKSKNFATGTWSLQHMSTLVGDDDDYDLSYDKLLELGVSVEPFLDMLFLDMLIFNYDRHTNNYGVLTSYDTILFAPIYDNNLSLLTREGIKDPKNQIGHAKIINKFLKEKNFYKYTALDIDQFKSILYDALNATLNLIPDEIENKDLIFNFVLERFLLYKE